MRKLFTITAMLVIGVTMLIGGPILIGRLQSGSPLAEFLKFGQCAIPCWMGVVPGQTTLYEARQILGAYYNESSGYSVTVRNNAEVRIDEKMPKKIALDVGFGSHSAINDYSIVNSILIVPEYIDQDENDRQPNKTATLADVVNLLGTPEGTFSTSAGSARYLQVWYAAYGVLEIDCSYADIFQSPIPNIMLQHYAPQEDMASFELRPWRGWWAACRFWRAKRFQ